LTIENTTEQGKLIPKGPTSAIEGPAMSVTGGEMRDGGRSSGHRQRRGQILVAFL
jgi:hypothetical protein